MKKYVFEAAKTQWEKPTEPKYVFCKPAGVTVFGAADEAEAAEMAAKKLRCRFQGTGVRFLGDVKLVAVYDVPESWSYGGGTGTAEDKAALYAANKR